MNKKDELQVPIGGLPQDVWPLEVEFVNAEQPEAIKFSSWAAQTEAAFGRLQKVIGDVYDAEGYMGILSPSLTSIIGCANFLHPTIPTDESFVYIEELAYGATTHKLRFHPQSILTNPSVYTDSNGSPYEQDVAVVNGEDISTRPTSTGKYTLDGRMLFTFDAAQANFIAYTIADGYANQPSHPMARANVIPDLGQIQKSLAGEITQLLRVEYISPTRYKITVPTIDFLLKANGPVYACEDLRYSIGGTKPSYQLPALLDGARVDILVDNILEGDDVGAGQPIGSNRILLWNAKTGLPVTSATDEILYYKYLDDDKSLIVIIPEGLPDVTNGVPNTDTYFLTCGGTNISETLGALLNGLQTHSHDATGGLINHSDLGYRFDSNEQYFSTDANYTVRETALANGGGYVKPLLARNPHPQYLRRMGYSAGSDPANLDNMMTGDLLMGSTNVGSGHVNLLGNSKGFRFGNASGPYLYYDNTADVLNLINKGLTVYNGVLSCYAFSFNDSFLSMQSGTPNEASLYIRDSGGTIKIRLDKTQVSAPAFNYYSAHSGYVNVPLIIANSVGTVSLSSTVSASQDIDGCPTTLLDGASRILSLTGDGAGVKYCTIPVSLPWEATLYEMYIISRSTPAGKIFRVQLCRQNMDTVEVVAEDRFSTANPSAWESEVLSLGNHVTNAHHYFIAIGIGSNLGGGEKIEITDIKLVYTRTSVGLY